MNKILLMILLSISCFTGRAFSAVYTLAMGQFQDLVEAEELLQFLSSKDYPVYIKYGSTYEVRVGSFSSWEKAKNLSKNLRDNERLLAKIVEDSNLESPILKSLAGDSSDKFIRERQIVDYRKQKLVKSALSFIYHPYIYGGEKVGRGIDCSYFAKLVYKSLGIKLPRSSYYQFKCGEKIKSDELEIGDLVFFRKGKRGRINHVGIYFGNNEFIHATRGAQRVTISNLSEKYYQRHYAGARRILKKI